jgi:hypothetical protein
MVYGFTTLGMHEFAPLSHDIIANSCALQEHHVSFVVIWGRKIHIWLFCSHSLEEMDWTAMLESSVFATEDRCRTRFSFQVIDRECRIYDEMNCIHRQ